MKIIILILGTLGFAGLMGCMYEPTPPAVNMIQKPADLAAESISSSAYTDPTTGKSRQVIVGIVRNVGETRSSANRTVKLIATTTVNGNPITEELANSVVPSLSPGAAFQIIGNLPQSLNPTTQYTLSVSPGDNNPANDLFLLNPSSPPRYWDSSDPVCKALSVQAGDLFEYVETEEKPKKKSEGVKSKERGK